MWTVETSRLVKRSELRNPQSIAYLFSVDADFATRRRAVDGTPSFWGKNLTDEFIISQSYLSGPTTGRGIIGAQLGAAPRPCLGFGTERITELEGSSNGRP